MSSLNEVNLIGRLDRPLEGVIWRCATCYHRGRFEAKEETHALA